MVDTTLSTNNSSRFIVVFLVLNVVSTVVFIFLTIYSGVVGTQCSVHRCFYFPHDTKNTTINREENKNSGGHYIEYQEHHYKS
jgi:hypothetical protein